jgi:hypothetical protein
MPQDCARQGEWLSRTRARADAGSSLRFFAIYRIALVPTLPPLPRKTEDVRTSASSTFAQRSILIADIANGDIAFGDASYLA